MTKKLTLKHAKVGDVVLIKVIVKGEKGEYEDYILEFTDGSMTEVAENFEIHSILERPLQVGDKFKGWENNSSARFEIVGILEDKAWIRYTKLSGETDFFSTVQLSQIKEEGIPA